MATKTPEKKKKVRKIKKKATEEQVEKKKTTAAKKSEKKETKKTAKKEAPKKQAEGALTEDMVKDITDELEALQGELEKSMRFAAAAKRARKHTTNLEKKFKQFRKASVEFYKKED